MQVQKWRIRPRSVYSDGFEKALAFTNTLPQLQGFIECCEKNQYSLHFFFFFEITEKNVFFHLNLIIIGTGDKTIPANNYLFKVNNRYVEYVQSLLWRYQNGVNDKNVNYWLGYRNKHDAAMQETYIHTITIFHILKITYFCMNFLFFVLNYTCKKIVFVGVFYSAFLTIQL